ncbi:carbohydrate ABC transporter permease [Cohnella silvisoli]|uniref:Sugar ABC transporter permease n=1 Tax=Cohnella silvisoli TaxID=2873699 RepID=A0ABV1KZ69_9BACL|nr:sugar ABC transporter permease [Cohnella silvisoli]MCD9024191.1 sugar ABC transporter permease [Cohnella silvisoli]
MDRLKSRHLQIAMFLLPALLFYAVLLVYPVLRTFFLSLHEWNGFAGSKVEYVAFDNFKLVFEDEIFWKSLKNVMVVMLLSIAIQIPAGLFLALLLNGKWKGIRFFKAAFFMPVIMSATSISLLWKFILYPGDGLVDGLLMKMGLEDSIRAWLADPSINLYTVILICCWQGLGVVMIIFLSGLVSIPDAIKEAALIDGANRRQRLWFVTLPLIREAVAINVILLVIGTLKIFDNIYVLTDGGPNHATDVLGTFLYKEAFRNNRFGMASAIAVVMFLLGFVLTLVANRAMRRESLDG